jgi:hypothetical protein
MEEMEMVKESRPGRKSGASIKVPSSSKVKTDSREAGTGSESGRLYYNERGQVCYGDNCVTLTIDPERSEIVVNVKSGAICNAEPLIAAMRETLGKGSRTVYEIQNEPK